MSRSGTGSSWTLCWRRQSRANPSLGNGLKIPCQEGKIRRWVRDRIRRKTGPLPVAEGPTMAFYSRLLTRTRARQPAPVQPLASRRVTYRSNRSNAPQNLLIFSHSGVASASASSGEQSLDAVDMSDAPSDQALAFPMGRRASFSRLWVPRTTAHPWRSSRARSGAPKRKGIDLVVFTRRAFDGECISDLY